MLTISVYSQTDSLETPETSVQERYTYKDGSKFVKDGEETVIIEIKDAFVRFKIIDDVMVFTVLYNPSSIFKKKGVEEYRIDSQFFKDPINKIYQARGSKFNGEGSLRDSYLFTFDPENSQLSITNVSLGMVEYVFTGQQIPDMSEFQKKSEELIKTQLKQLESE
jgi:hypothetical protein